MISPTCTARRKADATPPPKTIIIPILSEGFSRIRAISYRSKTKLTFELPLVAFAIGANA